MSRVKNKSQRRNGFRTGLAGDGRVMDPESVPGLTPIIGTNVVAGYLCELHHSGNFFSSSTVLWRECPPCVAFIRPWCFPSPFFSTPRLLWDWSGIRFTIAFSKTRVISVRMPFGHFPCHWVSLQSWWYWSLRKICRW
jgi:hypothetical protein